MTAAPEAGQRIYLRGGLDGDPLSFSVRWFVPAGFEAGSVSEVQSHAVGKAELTSCLTLLGVSACTAVAAAEHILRESQRARGIAYSQTVYVDATAEEVYRRLRLWDSARQRWGR